MKAKEAVNRRSKIKSGRSEQVIQVLIYCVVIGLCLAIILPCLNIAALSFNDGKDAAKGGIYFWPRMFTLDNYKQVFKDGTITKAYMITIARTVIGTAASLTVTSFAAYALKEKELPGRKILTMLITFTMLFGGGMIPTYIQYNKLGLVDHFSVYVVPGLVSVTYLDGCGYFGIFTRIVLPLSKPVIAVVGLYTAVNHWNDWFSGAFYMRSSRLWPVQTVLQQMLTRAMANKEVTSVAQAIAQNTNSVTSDSLKMAAVIITTVPILCVYPFAQKYFTKGAMIGAVKE